MTFRDHHRIVRISIRTMPLADPEAVERLQARIAAAAATVPARQELSDTTLALRDARFRNSIHYALAQPVPSFLRRSKR